MEQEQYQSACERYRPPKFHSQSDPDISSRTEIQRILGKVDGHHIPVAHSFFNARETQTLVD
jgi:hypothetical protein